jgi:hypothetical protein
MMRLPGGNEFPAPESGNVVKQLTYMGQELLNPASENTSISCW